MGEPSPSPGSSLSGRPLAVVTLLFMDMVDSVGLKQKLGDQTAGALMQRHDDEVRRLVSQIPGASEIKHNGDEFFLIFQRPSDAVLFAMRLHGWLQERWLTEQFPIRNRTGIHSGEVAIQLDPQTGRIRDLRGIQVDICSRVMRCAAAGQVVVTQFVAENARQMLRGSQEPGGGQLKWESIGRRKLRGVDERMELFEVRATGTSTPTNPLGEWRPSPSAVWVGALLAILSGLLFLSPLLRHWFVLPSYDLAFLLHSESIPNEAVVVYLDKQSHSELQQPYGQAWDHSLHAELLDRLKAAGSTAVVFDMVFNNQLTGAQNPAGHQRFLQAITNHGAVILAAVKNPPDLGGYEFPSVEMRDVARAYGAAEATPADEGYFRRHFPGERREGTNDLFSVAWRALTVVAPRSAEKLDPWEERWTRYYGPPVTLPHLSYYQILRGTNWQQLVKGRVVYVGTRADIGFTGASAVDAHPVPSTRWTGAKMPGVEICATTFLNLLRHDWLKRTSPVTELALLIVCGALLGGGLAWFRPLRAGILALLGAALVGVVALVLVWPTGVWFPWLIVAAVQAPVALGCSILLNTDRLADERKTLLDAIRSMRLLPAAPANPPPVANKPPGTPAPTAALEDAPSNPGRGTEVVVTPKIAHHTLLRRIGHGGYGEVWLCQNAVGIYHAVKIVYRRTFRSEAPFQREFQGISKFMGISRSHPGFVNILHVGREDADGYFFYIMEIADDEEARQPLDPATYSARTLEKVLRRRGGCLPAAECVELGVALASALAGLHKHELIHRDIKPANIIFVAGQPKLADIGLVTDVGAATIVGTQGFMPPEGPGKPLADLFSLGKVLYEASTGLRAEQFPELPPDLDSRPDRNRLLQLNEIFSKACDPDPRERYPSAIALHADLLRLRDQTNPMPAR